MMPKKKEKKEKINLQEVVKDIIEKNDMIAANKLTIQLYKEDREAYQELFSMDNFRKWKYCFDSKIDISRLSFDSYVINDYEVIQKLNDMDPMNALVELLRIRRDDPECYERMIVMPEAEDLFYLVGNYIRANKNDLLGR